MTLRLLAVHAHPDDESSKGAATYAYYRSLGAEVLVVSCTGGEQGSILNEQLEARAHAERDIAGLRVHEMRAAQQAGDRDQGWFARRRWRKERDATTAELLAQAAITLDALMRETRAA